jgi:hypothetical protein
VCETDVERFIVLTAPSTVDGQAGCCVCRWVFIVFYCFDESSGDD